MGGLLSNKLRHVDFGFTLLEVLVAVSIASIVFVVLLSGFSVNIKSTGIAEDYTIAAFLSKEIMVKLETQKDIKAGKSEGDFGEEYPRFRWIAEIEKDGILPFYKVNLKVFFNRGMDERELSVGTIILEETALQK